MKKHVAILKYELPITVTSLKEGGYLAQCKKLQGCMAEGETVEQAISYVTDVARQILDIYLEEDIVIPLQMIKNPQKELRLSVPLAYHV